MAKAEVVKLSKADLQKWLSGDELEELDPSEVVASMALRDASASTVDEVLAGPDEVLHGNEYVDVPFQLNGVEWRRSKIGNNANGRYGIFNIVDVNGERRVMTCGATHVMVRAARLVELDALPIAVIIRGKATQTESGGVPLWLERAPADF